MVVQWCDGVFVSIVWYVVVWEGAAMRSGEAWKCGGVRQCGEEVWCCGV